MQYSEYAIAYFKTSMLASFRHRVLPWRELFLTSGPRQLARTERKENVVPSRPSAQKLP